MVNGWKLTNTRALLLAVEARGHRAGWDNTNPTLYLLYDERDTRTRREYRALLCPQYGSAIHAHPYAAQPAAVINDAVGGGTAEQVYRFGVGLTGALPLQAARYLLACRQPGFFGVGFMGESYTMDVDEAEMAARLAGASRPKLADTVGAVETRHVVAVDIDGHSYLVERRRDTPPVFYVVEAGAEPAADSLLVLGGLVHRGLRLATAVIAGQPVPADALLPQLLQ